MTKNDSYIVVHHYIDGLSNVKFMTLISCIVLVIVIVLVLMIILAVVVFLLLRRYKIEPQTVSNPQSSCETLRESSTHSVLPGGAKKSLPCTSATNPAAVFDDETDINSNVQHIAMAGIKPRLENVREDSSESSAGLCDVLFPSEHEGEVVYESPPKLMAFAGRVFASTRRKSRVSRTESKVSKPESKQSSCERKTHSETHSSLEWDYFESRHLNASNALNRPEVIEKDTIDVCWV